MSTLSEGEKNLLTAIGYIVVRWNHAEFCARQLLRADVGGSSIDDPEHIALSKRNAAWIEEELRRTTLPNWTPPGKPYLEHLIDAYSMAREHRNHIVHGPRSTHGDKSAVLGLFPLMPKDGKAQLPQPMTTDQLMSVAKHFHQLAMYAEKVLLAFDQFGNRALNANGDHAIAVLPDPISPLPPVKYTTTADI